MIRLEIEAESVAALHKKVIEALHLPIDIGVNILVREPQPNLMVTSSPALNVGDTVASSDGDATITAVVTAEDKPKRKRRTKAEMEAARALDVVAEAPKADEPELPFERPTEQVAPVAALILKELPEVTEADLRAKLQELNDSVKPNCGLSAVLALVKEYGCKQIRDLKPEDYAAIVAKADELLNG